MILGYPWFSIYIAWHAMYPLQPSWQQTLHQILSQWQTATMNTNYLMTCSWCIMKLILDLLVPLSTWLLSTNTCRSTSLSLGSGALGGIASTATSKKSVKSHSQKLLWSIGWQDGSKTKHEFIWVLNNPKDELWSYLWFFINHGKSIYILWLILILIILWHIFSNKYARSSTTVWWPSLW